MYLHVLIALWWQPVAVKLQPVALQLKSQPRGDAFLQGFDLGIDKFDHLAGGQIDQMVMMRTGTVFIACAAIAKFQLLKNAGFLKELHRAVDRRQRNPGIQRHSAAVQLFDIGVVLGLAEDAGDQPAGGGHAQACGFAAGDQVFPHGANSGGSDRTSCP